MLTLPEHARAGFAHYARQYCEFSRRAFAAAANGDETGYNAMIRSAKVQSMIYWAIANAAVAAE